MACIRPTSWLTGRHAQKSETHPGGIGAGTVVITDMEVYGTKRTFRLKVTEPQPGRVLAEEDAAAGTTTTFTVEPVGDGSQARVTIATYARVGPGFSGWMERMLNPYLMRKIYNEELQQLANYVTQQSSPDSPTQLQ
jgi:hypothetical protein